MINLLAKFSPKALTEFVKESLVAPHFSNDYDFVGAKTVQVLTPVTVPMNDYQRTGANRYGDPQEMQDVMQELTLSQDKSFAITIDKGNYEDQGQIKKAAKMLGLQIAERAIPLEDTYALNVLANKAGNIKANAAAPKKTDILDRVMDGTEALDNAEVPDVGRTLFVTAEVYKLLKLYHTEFHGIETLGKDAISKGKVGTIDNMEVIKVPAKRMPKGVNFIIAHKSSGCMPMKIAEARVHEDAPGISGALLEGRRYYDFFVLGTRSKGVYVDITTSDAVTVCAAPTISGTTLSSTTGGVTFRWTTDGSDPRFSTTYKEGSTCEEGDIRAYCFKAGSYESETVDLVAGA